MNVEQKKLKYEAHIIAGQSPSSDSYNTNGDGLPFLQGCADFGEIHPVEKYYSNEPKKVSKFGDVLISVRAPVGELNISNKEYSIGRGLAIVRGKRSRNKFLYYILEAEKYNLDSISMGSTFKAISSEDLRNHKVFVPGIDHQETIEKFLDHKTYQIDTLIEDKEKLIELLEEKRQAVITEAVTKGLNPEVPMKGSGVAWIGEIPEHWEEKRIKFLFREKDSRNYDEDARLLSLFTSIGVRPRKQMEEKGNKSQTVINYKIVNKGDIVVNKLLAWMGSIGISAYYGVTSPDYDIYQPVAQGEISSEYYHYYFRNFHFKGDCYKHGRGIMLMRWRTYSDDFKRITVVNPPIQEQKEIAAYLDSMSDEVDFMIQQNHKIISRLKEYRQSLIYEAVTGKIDVQEMERDLEQEGVSSS